MSLFGEMVLFSDVEGQITLNGSPVSGAQVVQEISFNEPNDIPSRSVTTDANGKFAFDKVVKGRGLIQLLPHQPSILQRLVIRYDGKEYEGWRHSKQSYEPDTEVKGKPFRLICDLNNAPGFEGTHYGVCRIATD